MRRLVLGALVLLPACIAVPAASPSAQTPAPLAATPAPAPFVFLPPCPDAVRPQVELDFAGLPPLVPDRALLRCLKVASSPGSAYDAGSDHLVVLADGHDVTLYERRGMLPVKPTVASVRSGVRLIDGQSWHWEELVNGSTVLSATTRGTYVELSARGDASQVDVLATVAASLRPVSTWPRPAARDVCASIPGYSSGATVAAAFDSTAAAISRWEETPEYPGGPHVLTSDWRKAPPDEVVTLCYLDGAFGPARVPPPPAGATPLQLPNYDRIVVQLGIDRRPITRTFGWRDRIAIRDPGR